MTDGGRRGDLKYRSAARHARLAAQIWFIQFPESSAINDNIPGEGDVVVRICRVLGVVSDCQKRAILF